MRVFKDLMTILRLNGKLFFANKLALGVLAAVTGIFVIVSSFLIKEYDKKASLPIGVLDEDGTELSKQVIAKLKEIDGFVVYEWEQETLQAALEKETIYAYFVLGKGFEEKVKADQTEGIVRMYYLSDYSFISILSDIFAKSMMKDVILYTSDQLYEEYMEKNNLVKTQQYVPYMKQLHKEEQQGMFERFYYKVGEDGLTQSIETKNTILSSQLFLGVVSLFEGFLAMFFVMCLRKKKEVFVRMRISMISVALQEVGNVVTLLIAEGIFGVMASVYVCRLLRISFLKHGICTVASMMIFMGILSALFGCISKLIEKETTYQLLCVLILFLMGGLSILMSIGQISIPVLSNIAKNIPNYWFITDIIDIILAGKAAVRFFPVAVLAGLAFVYTGITDIKLKVFAR